MEKIKKIVLAIILLYKKAISPLLPISCRYVPSCSTYTMICIQRYGIAKGIFLGLIRILRCNPFFEGGFDPPPTSQL